MNNSYAFVDPSYEDFLMHYGRLGQRKGVRNFERYDGTLTPEGKERYSIYWKKGTNLKGKRVDYDDDGNSQKGGSSERKKTGAIAKALNIGTANYEKPDGSLTAAGKKKFGDILTKKEMENLVRNYNKTNGTKYKVGEVTFRKNGKLYTPEGKRFDENTEIDSVGVASLKKKLFGVQGAKAADKPGLISKFRDTKYKQEIRNMRNMSDEEIRRAIDRARLEKDYIRELGIQKSAGEKFIDGLKSNAMSIAGDAAKNFAKETGQAFLNQVVKPKLYEATGLKLNNQGDKFAQAKKEAQYEWDKLNALKYRQQREGMERSEAEKKNGGGKKDNQQPQQKPQKEQQQPGQQQQQTQQESRKDQQPEQQEQSKKKKDN